MTARWIPIAAALLLSPAACNKKDAATVAPAPAPAPAPVAEAPKVDPIPAGWFTLTPQLAVPDVAAAIDYYGKAFGAETLLELPGPDGKTFHAEVKIGDSLILLAEAGPELASPSSLGGTPVTLMLYVDDADAVFTAATEAGAEVEMDVADMFWGDRYGQLTDPFGHRWAVASHLEELTDEQIRERGELMAADAKKRRRRNKEPSWKQVVGTPAESKIPKDYHSVTMSLVLSDSGAAIDFYKAAFGATERSRMPTADGKVMHAEVLIGDTVLMMSDEFPEQGGKSAATLGGSPVTIHHYVNDATGVHKKAVEAGGKSALEVEDMFWGDKYGLVIDPVMIPWSLATHIEDVSEEEMVARLKARALKEDANEE